MEWLWIPMKTAILVLLASTACAQVPIKPNELACGTATLKLSMPQAGAVQALKENGYTLADSGRAGETNLPIEIWASVAAGLCEISFNSGKLVYVERHWKPRTENARDTVEAVINAIQSVTKQQNVTPCDIFSYANTEPSATHKAVTVTCDGHKIEISVVDTNQLHTYEIEESIGSFLKNRP